MDPRVRRQSTVVFLLAALFVLAGLGHLGALVVWGGWPTVEFALLLGAGAVLLGAGLWARHGRPSWPRRHIAHIAGVAVAGGIFVWVTGVDQVERRTFVMTWALGSDSSARYPDRPHVTLTFRDWPACRLDFFSTELAEYLAPRGAETVELELEITKDFGAVRGYGVYRVGPFVHRNLGWSGSRCSGACPGVPWQGKPPGAGCP